MSAGLVFWASGAVVWIFAAFLLVRAHRLRQARLVRQDVVFLDGRLETVAAVGVDKEGIRELAFEPLGEMLAREITVGAGRRTLYEILVEAGWKAPAKTRPTFVEPPRVI